MGRVSRKLANVQVSPGAAPPAACALCERALGGRVEWHHIIPKSHGGRETVPLHPICHRAIHAAASNADLARLGTIEAMRRIPAVARFLAWIANKPPDFHAPTRKPR